MSRVFKRINKNQISVSLRKIRIIVSLMFDLWRSIIVDSDHTECFFKANVTVCYRIPTLPISVPSIARKRNNFGNPCEKFQIEYMDWTELVSCDEDCGVDCLQRATRQPLSENIGPARGPQVSVLQNPAQAVSNTDESAAIVERVEPKHDSAQCLHWLPATSKMARSVADSTDLHRHISQKHPFCSLRSY